MNFCAMDFDTWFCATRGMKITLRYLRHVGLNRLEFSSWGGDTLLATGRHEKTLGHLACAAQVANGTPDPELLSCKDI